MSQKEIENAIKKARSACMVVINPTGDGSILAITRREDFNDIGFPGGKIDLEQNENPSNAAVRECYEETGIMVDQKHIIPLHCGFARSMDCFTFYAPRILGGKLLQASKEGMPLWVHPHMLLKDKCTYKHYNIKIISKLVSEGII